MYLKPQFSTNICINSDGYLCISQSDGDDFPTVRLSPDQVSDLRGFLHGKKFKQLNAWRSAGAEEEDGEA